MKGIKIMVCAVLMGVVGSSYGMQRTEGEEFELQEEIKHIQQELKGLRDFVPNIPKKSWWSAALPNMLQTASLGAAIGCFWKSGWGVDTRWLTGSVACGISALWLGWKQVSERVRCQNDLNFSSAFGTRGYKNMQYFQGLLSENLRKELSQKEKLSKNVREQVDSLNKAGRTCEAYTLWDAHFVLNKQLERLSNNAEQKS